MKTFYNTIIIAIYDGCYYMEIMLDNQIYEYSERYFKDYPKEIQDLMIYIRDNYYGKDYEKLYVDYIHNYCDYYNLYIIDNGSISIK